MKTLLIMSACMLLAACGYQKPTESDIEQDSLSLAIPVDSVVVDSIAVDSTVVDSMSVDSLIVDSVK